MRAAVALALAVVLALVGACGGEDDREEVELGEWAVRACGAMFALSEGAFDNSQVSSPALLRFALNRQLPRFISAADDALDQLDAIRPPSEAADLHDDLVGLLDDLRDAAVGLEIAVEEEPDDATFVGRVVGYQVAIEGAFEDLDETGRNEPEALAALRIACS